MRLRVSNRTSMIIRGEYVPPGTVLSTAQAESMTKEQLDDHVKSGFLVDISSEKPDYGVDPEVPLLPREIDLTKKEGLKELRSVQNEPARVATKWTRDPKSLKNKTLDQLNVMIAEIDPSVDSATSVEDAIAILSMDFRRVSLPK